MITFNSLKEIIKQKKEKGQCFILYSKDLYSIKQIQDLLLKSLIMPEVNFSIVDASVLNEKKEIIKTYCETIPMLESKRVIVVKADFLEEGDKDTLKLTKYLCEYIKDIPDFSVLVLYFYQKDKRENIKKNEKVQKLEKAGATLVTNEKNQSVEMNNIINAYCRKYSVELPNDTKAYMIQSADNLDVLTNELKKIEFIDDLSVDNIKKSLSFSEDNDVFDLVENIGCRKSTEALEIFNDLISQGQQPISILCMLTRQFKLLYYCKLGLDSNKTSDEIAKDQKLHPYQAKLLCDQVKNYKIEELENNLELCINSENKTKKTGINAKTEVETLIINALSQ